jgi:chemotaxis signal transduction protein
MNWPEIRRTLAEAEQRLQFALTPSTEMAQAKLAERAKTIQTRRVSIAVAATEELITFQYGEEHLGLLLIAIREVVPLRACTPVPGARPLLVGVHNIRGTIHSVIDPRAIATDYPRSDAVVPRYALVLKGAPSIALAASSLHTIAKFPAGTARGGEVIQIDQQLTRIIATEQVVAALRSDVL